jgi:hypothetical protein
MWKAIHGKFVWAVVLEKRRSLGINYKRLRPRNGVRSVRSAFGQSLENEVAAVAKSMALAMAMQSSAVKNTHNTLAENYS